MIKQFSILIFGLSFILTPSLSYAEGFNTIKDSSGNSFKVDGDKISGNNGVNYNIVGSEVYGSDGSHYTISGSTVLEDGKPVGYIGNGRILEY